MTVLEHPSSPSRPESHLRTSSCIAFTSSSVSERSMLRYAMR
jgi:hypothetical protein